MLLSSCYYPAPPSYVIILYETLSDSALVKLASSAWTSSLRFTHTMFYVFTSYLGHYLMNNLNFTEQNRTFKVCICKSVFFFPLVDSPAVEKTVPLERKRQERRN